MPLTLSERGKVAARAMWAKYKLPISDRFWSKVDKKGEDECWNWIARKNQKGYGVFNLEHPRHDETGVRVLAPRMAWQLANGPIPEGKYTLHKCDNPACVNPSHLFIGSLRDNTQDMLRKGREKNGNRKLTGDQVREIRAKYRKGEYGYIKLAKEYGVHQGTIVAIISRRNWKRV